MRRSEESEQERASESATHPQAAGCGSAHTPRAAPGLGCTFAPHSAPPPASPPHQPSSAPPTDTLEIKNYVIPKYRAEKRGQTMRC